MKSQIFWKWSLGLSLTVLPLAGGCLRAGSDHPATGSDAVSEVAPSTNSAAASLDSVAAVEGTATNAPAVDISEAEVRPIKEETPLPADVRTTGPAGDFLKLAASGVDEKVLRAYITNSPSTFNLTADEIIYLKDLGVGGDVITSALARDQELMAAAGGAAAANAGITTNWIGAAQNQPDASQVAPQMTTPASGEGAPESSTAPVAAPVPQTDATYSQFDSSLAPYGTWLEVDGYGRVWQPTVVVVNPGWSPYYDCGRWIYTDCGWYWASDYSWGWAPFHYGRWFRHHRIGWCWAPDLVWGPSWVTWRYNDLYCGWAPLPPAACYRPGFGFTYYGSSVGFGFGFGLTYDCYSFVSWNRFHDHHHNHLHAVPHYQARQIYNDTRAVTRIVANKNGIINEGISAQRVSAATRTEVRKVSLREANDPRVVSGRAERLDPARRTLTVYKPDVTRAQRTAVSSAGQIHTAPGTASAFSPVNAGRETRTRSATSVAGQPSRAETRTYNRVTSSGASPGQNESVPRVSVTPQTSGRTGNSRSAPAATNPGRVNSTPNSSSRPETRGATGHSAVPGTTRPAPLILSGQQSQTPQSQTRVSVPTTQPQQQSASQLRQFNASRSQASQPSVWSSTRASQTPSRTERTTVPAAPSTSFQARSVPVPQSPPPAVQYRQPATPAPSVAAPRQYSAPQTQSSPSGNYSGSSFRQYSAPSKPSVSSPAPMPSRQYSAPAPHQYSSTPSARESRSAMQSSGSGGSQRGFSVQRSGAGSSGSRGRSER